MSEHRNDSASRTSLLRKRLKFYTTVTRVETRTLFLKQLRIIIVKISDNLYFFVQLKEADQQETQIFRALNYKWNRHKKRQNSYLCFFGNLKSALKTILNHNVIYGEPIIMTRFMTIPTPPPS